MPLASNVTLRDLVDAHTLREPVRYVRGVLHNMVLYRRQFGTATVQLGITGEGRSPHYRMSPVPDPDQDLLAGIRYKLEAKFLGNDPQQQFVAYHGMSHKPLEEITPEQMTDSNWSDGRSDFEEVEALFRELKAGNRANDS